MLSSHAVLKTNKQINSQTDWLTRNNCTEYMNVIKKKLYFNIFHFTYKVSEDEWINDIASTIANI